MVTLDWRDPEHWNGGRQRPCRLCGKLTFLLDTAGRPAHKVCVEEAVAKMAEERKRS